MDINWPALIAGAAVASVFTYYAGRASDARQPGELKFGSLIKGLGLVCLIIPVGSLLVFLSGNYQVGKPGETAALLGLSLGFGVLAIYTLAEGFLVRGSYDESAISFSSPWSGRKNEKWEDLESVEFNRLCGWYELKFRSGNVIRLSSYLGGRRHLLVFLQMRGHDTSD